MRRFLIILLCLALQAVSMSAAQTNPTIEIVLSQPTAHEGEIVTAEVWVRNARTVGGIDLGITVDADCLRIVDRQPGGFLPTTETEGAFATFSAVNDHDTRLAVALADRTRHASGDGVFYRVQLEPTCGQGSAAVTVARAQVSSYIDPQAEIIDLINYEMDKGTLNIVNAQLTLLPAEATAEVPTATSEAAPTLTSAPATAVPTATTEIGPTPTLATVTTPETGSPQSNLMVIVLVVLTLVVIVLLAIGIRILRSGRKDNR
ncbi:MAG: hypothetical protein IT320_26915 [Anaerolineae bacterium]|nr:hypothetical protein [Anaerolineae bacterium]